MVREKKTVHKVRMECVKVFLYIRYHKIIDELYGGKITVVQLVLTMPNPIDFVKYYDRIGI